MAGFTRSQIDRLGERLRKGSPSQSDIRLLDDYRRSFGDAYGDVIRILREQRLLPTGRSAKSTMSIIDKLRRESIRLSQMQDIAGCRVVVSDTREQEQVVGSLTPLFERAAVIDRRANPSHGYRAVHIIAEMHGKPIEIQVRTQLQHLWAELSERASDVIDAAIKYGAGPDNWREMLAMASTSVEIVEKLEEQEVHFAAEQELMEKVEEATQRIAIASEAGVADEELARFREEVEAVRETVERNRQERRAAVKQSWRSSVELFSRTISWLDQLKGRKQ